MAYNKLFMYYYSYLFQSLLSLLFSYMSNYHHMYALEFLFPPFPNNYHIIVTFPKHWISSSLIHFINLFRFYNIFVLYITYGSRIFNPLILKFSYSIFGSIISAIYVPYLSTCPSNLSYYYLFLLFLILL